MLFFFIYRHMTAMQQFNSYVSYTRLFILILFFSSATSGVLLAQEYLIPGANQTEPILLLGGTAHIGNGDVISECGILLEEGRIVKVGSATDFSAADRNRARVIETAGMEIYPGFIAPETTLGLVEISAVRATRDQSEVGPYTPNVRALIAYSTDSKIIPTVRSNGVLVARITPEGGRITGTSSVVHLDAWNWEDAALLADDGIHLNWINLYRRSGWWTGGGVQRNDKYDDEYRELQTFIDEAAAYARNAAPEERNLFFEGMKGLFDGSKQLYIQADKARAITEAVLFAGRYDLKPVITGGSEAWKVADFLRDNGVAVILDRTHRLPEYPHTPVDQPYKTPAILHEAGVTFCIGIVGSDGFWQQRNLPFHAGHAVGYGLPYEAAVQAITLDAARTLRIDDRCGSLEEGKDATLFVSEGDALDMATNNVVHAWIQGRRVDLNNKQKMLYRKYQTKYSRN